MNWKYYNPQFDFGKYLRNQDSAWSGHLSFAYDLVRNTEPKIIVELGTHRGHSFFSFAQAVKDGELQTKLYAIDSWEGDPQAGYYGAKIYQEVTRIVKEEYQSLDINILRGYFQKFVKDFNNDSIDILHIDGLHTYKAVKADFEMWRPKMRKNGIILMHDISEKKKGFGVYRLWAELITKYSTISLEYAHGLGLILLDMKEYEIFKALENSWQNYYFNCYQVIALDIGLAEKKEQIKNLSQIQNNLLKEVQNKDEQIKGLNLKLGLIENSRTWKARNKLARVLGRKEID